MNNKIINSRYKEYYKIFHIFTNKRWEVTTKKGIIHFIHPISKNKFLEVKKSLNVISCNMIIRNLVYKIQYFGILMP